jgi:hypothetical protein
VVSKQGLFRDASPPKSKQRPGHERNDRGREEMFDSCQGESRKNEDESTKEASGKEECGRDMRHYRGMQAERDAASESCGNRNGRQLHGAFRNLTSVSM